MSGKRRRELSPEDEERLRLTLRPLDHFERVQVSYPATVAVIVQQALDMKIPEEAELVSWTQYDADGPQVFFQWPVYSDGKERQGRHERRSDNSVQAAHQPA